MKFADVDPAYQGFVSDRLARSGFSLDGVPMDIAEADEMFVRGILPGYPGRPGAAYYRYMESSARTLDVYAQLAGAVGGLGALDRVLDFGSGHGRLTRMLKSFVEPRRIWACDLYYEAVAWQAEHYGVNGLVSVSDPARFALDERHAIVFAASVFSHLPDGLFQRWLARLHELVAPGGVLAFSVHGAGFAPEGQTISDEGLGYAGWSESQTHDPAHYGMSYVTDAYVRRAIETACGPAAAKGTRAFRSALFESQDLYVVPGAAVDLASLDITSAPIGSFARTSTAETWQGWAVDLNAGADIVEVGFFVGEEQRGVARPEGPADQVRDFFPGVPNVPVRWSIPALDLEPGTTVRAELVSSGGRRGHCYARIENGGGLTRS